MKSISDPRKTLRLAIWRRARAWAKIYREQPDSALLIRSMLIGIETGIQRRIGTLPPEARGAYGCPEGLLWKAHAVGQQIAEELPASTLPRA